MTKWWKSFTKNLLSYTWDKQLKWPKKKKRFRRRETWACPRLTSLLQDSSTSPPSQPALRIKPLTWSPKFLCNFTRSCHFNIRFSTSNLLGLFVPRTHDETEAETLADVRNWLQTGWQDTHPVFHRREKRLMMNHLPHCSQSIRLLWQEENVKVINQIHWWGGCMGLNPSHLRPFGIISKPQKWCFGGWFKAGSSRPAPDSIFLLYRASPRTAKPIFHA